MQLWRADDEPHADAVRDRGECPAWACRGLPPLSTLDEFDDPDNPVFQPLPAEVLAACNELAAGDEAGIAWFFAREGMSYGFYKNGIRPDPDGLEASGGPGNFKMMITEKGRMRAWEPEASREWVARAYLD